MRNCDQERFGIGRRGVSDRVMRRWQRVSEMIEVESSRHQGQGLCLVHLAHHVHDAQHILDHPDMPLLLMSMIYYVDVGE